MFSRTFPRTAPTVRGEYLPALHLTFFNYSIAKNKTQAKTGRRAEKNFLMRYTRMKYEFFKNVTSKEELYSQYKKLAMEHHPDHGGRVEDMQKINAEYNDLKARVWNTHKSATGETYTSETATADAPDRFRDIINAVMGFNIDLELCGCWLWAFNAYECKDELKNLGFFYCSKKRAWAWTDEEPKKNKHKLTMDEIRDQYGSEKIRERKDETKRITGAA